MLISPKSNPFSIDSLLGIKETVAEPKDNENTTQNETLCKINPKGEGKLVTEGRADFERNQIDRVSYSTLNLRGDSLHAYGKSDYDSENAFRFISERQREVLLQRQNEQLEHCRVRYWGAQRYHDPLSQWQYRYPSQGPLSRFIDSSLSLPNLRKSKRIRTAFSPTQLLQLEHAFEKNHYVVGQERKELALKLGLSETQVKVWFQNRRTKYKRVKAEEDMTMAPSKNRSHVIRDQVTKKSDSRYDSSSAESDIDV